MKKCLLTGFVVLSILDVSPIFAQDSVSPVRIGYDEANYVLPEFVSPGINQWSIPMVNGQWSITNGQWSMVNNQWSMVNGQ